MSALVRYFVPSVLGAILIGLFGFGVSRALAGQWGAAVPVFGLAVLGGAIVFSVVYRMRQGADASSTATPSGTEPERADAPWTVRPEWRTDTLIHENEVEWGALIASVLSAVLCGIGGGMIIYAWATRPNPALWPALVGLVFLGLAGYLAYAGVQKFRRQYRFSESRLELETMPGCLGTPFRAQLYAPIADAAASEHEITVKLTCKRRYEATIPDERPRKRTRTVTKWADEHQVAGTPRLREHRVLEVPIEFDLPEEPPPSTPEKEPDRILWELRVTIPDADYEATFEIPVFEPDAVPPAHRPSEADRPATDAEYHRRRESAVEEAMPENWDRASSGSSTSDTGAIEVEETSSEGLRVRVGMGGQFCDHRISPAHRPGNRWIGSFNDDSSKGSVSIDRVRSAAHGCPSSVRGTASVHLQRRSDR